MRKELLRRNIHIFNSETFKRIFHTSSDQTKYFLEQQTHDGLFLRLKKGLYALKTDPPAEEEIANVLYRPSYISFEYALAYYNLIPEMPYLITSATTKPTRLFTSEDHSFAYYTIKPEAYTGYTLLKGESKTFLIAEPEKALIDYLYFVSLGKRTINDRFMYQSNSVKKEKMIEYAHLFGRESVLSLLENYL